MRDRNNWSWKLMEAVERIKTRYEHIGRKTGAPFLAIIYPPEAQTAVFKEWQLLSTTLGDEFVVRNIDVLNITSAVIEDLGAENIVMAINDPMPGSNPEAELGQIWVSEVVKAVNEAADSIKQGKPVLCLNNLAALYPAASPRSVMQEMWDGSQTELNGPVIVLIPGTLVDRRVYSFVNQYEEFMYRGDIL